MKKPSRNKTDKVVFPARGRFIVAWWVLPSFYPPGLTLVYSFIDIEAEWYWYDISYYFYFYLLMLSLLIFQLKWNAINWKKMVSIPTSSDFSAALELTAFVLVFSLLAAYLMFLPLSYLIPEFVNFWFIDIPSVIYSNENGYPWLPNLLSFVILVVLAPIIEEFVFRGVLLHRWSEKWSLTVAILVSSLTFGILHADPIGAAAFGVAMCLIYLNTQTLIVPIACHALNNLVSWLWAIWYEIKHGPNHKYTIDEFRDEWLLAFASGLIVFLWVSKYVRSENTLGALALPSLGKK